MKFKRAAGEDILSVLGEGVELQGELSFTGGLRVDGSIKGKIRSEGALVIGPKGKVEAEVHVHRASLRGEFHGVIHASDRIEIHTDGKVHGDLYTPCLIIEAGALFEGKCNMGERKAAADGSVLKAVENLN